MPDVNMPKLSDTMEEGTVLEWKKKDGDEVHKGDVLAEVESDKATFDLEAEDDGVLSIRVEKGVPAKIGAPIATIGPAGSAPAAKPAKPDGEKPAKAKVEAPKAEAEPAAEAETAEGPEDEAPAAKEPAAEAETAEGPED
jgi:pyruvate dehydrogenase E2 component (dihydrolipoamide acetyltransferase)